MTHYIDKSALVAEIERRVKTNKECMLGLRNLDYYQGKVDALNDTICFLDTIEVKVVNKEPVNGDLKKACNNYCLNARKGYPRVKDDIDIFIENAFKAGAQWQKEQLKANTVDATIGLPYENKDGGYTHLIDV